MKNLFYDEGPEMMSFGEAGLFRIGEPQPVADNLAEKLLARGRLKEFQDAAKQKTAKKEA